MRSCAFFGIGEMKRHVIPFFESFLICVTYYKRGGLSKTHFRHFIVISASLPRLKRNSSAFAMSHFNPIKQCLTSMYGTLIINARFHQRVCPLFEKFSISCQKKALESRLENLQREHNSLSEAHNSLEQLNSNWSEHNMQQKTKIESMQKELDELGTRLAQDEENLQAQKGIEEELKKTHSDEVLMKLTFISLT